MVYPSTLMMGAVCLSNTALHPRRLILFLGYCMKLTLKHNRTIPPIEMFSYVITDLSQRVDSVKEENLKLQSENLVLGQYIENLMSASSVFQSTSPKTKKK
jgi:hypothetical protein